ncbi:MAG: hypothetical protein RBS92_05185 [Candidatus Cloacimonadales bacterium]|nr:hypothetical protein [Candidatus Cloacimonadales bacterium]
MRVIILVCIIIFSNLLYAEVFLHSSFLNFNHYSTLETNINYNNRFQNNYYLDYNATFENTSNSYFDRSNKNSKVSWSLKREGLYFPIRLDYVYQYSLNEGLPEDTISVIDRQTQIVNLSANKSFYDIFNIRQDFAYTTINAQNNDYHGHFSESALETNYQSDYWQLNNSTKYNINYVFLDKKENYLSDFTFAFNDGHRVIESNINLSQQIQDLYIYNTKSDVAKRVDYNDWVHINMPFMQEIIWNFEHNGNLKKNTFETNHERENSSYEQFIDTSLENDNQYFFLVIGSQNGYTKRHLNSNNQDRKSIDKALYSNIKVYQNVVDSLSIKLSVLLTQNYHSQDFKMLDNDRQIQIGSIYLKEQLNPIILLKSLFSIQRNHEVYIDKSLSSNNNRKTTYIFQPEIVSNLTEKLQLFNNYNLKSNYENYIWNEHLNDRFYRRLSAEFGFKANRLNKNPESSLQVSGIYETNETAEKQGANWYRNNQNIIRTIAVQLNMFNDNFEYKVAPQVKYHYQKHEFDILFNMNWYFAKDSAIRFNINPIGNTFNKFIWKAFINIDFVY